VDPTVTTLVSQGFPRADLILITHDHSDHFQTNGTALRNLTNANTAIIAPLLVSQQMAAYMKDLTNRVTVLTNGAATAWMGLSVQAVPAYNSNHPQGRGNGYVLTIAGQRIYISGDTGNVVELLQLTNLDYAFVCMDGQYNMKTNEAAQVVRAIHPKVVYPYHYNTAKPEVFKSAVGADLGIEVRLRKWE
jgi:L-ascorbate metabolism protein UlaG (beta-lactamase superfamily)